MTADVFLSPCRAIFVLLLCCASSLLHATSGLPYVRDFDQLFRHELAQANVPGGAYAIVKPDHIVHVGSFGQREQGDPTTVDADTVFRIASVSKTFAAELTALLVHEGRLRWDDKVSVFTPELKLASYKHLHALQLQHLLSHSTGIVSNAYDNLLDADVPVNKILPRFKELKPLCEPGKCYTYQNILFSLIEPAVEQVTHQPYETVLAQRLLQPLKMNNTSIGMAAYLANDNRATPHIKRKGQWAAVPVRTGYYEVKPAAGVNASVNDLAIWLMAQMGNRPDVIPAAVIDQITTKRQRTVRDLHRRNWRELVSDAHYGLGWRIYRIHDEELYLHAGWVKGFVAEIAYSKKRQTGLVVLLNAESNVISGITSAFWKQQFASPVLNAELVAE